MFKKIKDAFNEWFGFGENYSSVSMAETLIIPRDLDRRINEFKLTAGVPPEQIYPAHLSNQATLFEQARLNVPEAKDEEKWKFAYYVHTPNPMRYPNSKPQVFKTRTKNTAGNTSVEVYYHQDADNKYRSVQLSGTSELNVDVELSTKYFTIDMDQALDLYLALHKYFEVKGEANFVKKAKNEL